ILAVANLVKSKRLDIVIGAFSRIAPEFPDVALLIAGEGPERKRIEELSGLHHLDGRVQLLGSVQPRDMASLYLECEFTVLGTDREGMPNCVLESLSFGKPVVATRVGGIP